MAILFEDNFNRADGGLGADWTAENGGTFAIVSNEARCSVANLNPESIRYVNALAARADMNVQCRMKLGNVASSTTHGQGIIARRTASNTFYYLLLQGGPALVVQLRRQVAGIPTVIDTLGSLVDGGNYHTWRLEVFGNQISVYRDNVAQGASPYTDGNITGSGRGGIHGRNISGADRGHYDDFFIGDTAGEIISGQINSDHLIPLQFKYSLNSDILIPLQFRYRLNADSEIPIEWNIDGFIRSDHTIPLQFRTTINSDLVIPISIRLPGGLVVDFLIPIQMRRELHVDQIIPILWKLFSGWVAQGASQTDDWVEQDVSQSDDWTKQSVSQPDDWSPV